jgi:hypothetical protein
MIKERQETKMPKRRKKKLIDFQLKPGFPGRGLTLALVPNFPDGSQATDEAIIISEDAFGFIEPCISTYWPNYNNYGHWGMNKIPSAVWLEILDYLASLSDKWLTSNSIDDMRATIFTFDDIERQLHEDFTAIRESVVAMISNLIYWLQQKVIKYDYISIYGI